MEQVRSVVDTGGIVPVEVYDVAVDPTVTAQPLILKEKSRDRFLPIVIGICEANAIASRLNGIETPRPMTHDLMADILRELKIEVKQVVINDFDESAYYARIVLIKDGSSYEVDARPSDAIALAVRVSTPIYVAKKVMESNAISPGAEPYRDRPSPAKKIGLSPGKKI
jgi:bifunctional DNase/RNase